MNRPEVLVMGDYKEDFFSEFASEALIHVHPSGENTPPDCLERIEVAVTGWFPQEWIGMAPHLKYFFIPFAGLTPQLRQTLLARPDLTVGNAHFASDFVAEHVFASLFYLNRNLRQLDRFMRRPALLRRSPPPPQIVALRDKTIGIVGHGHIGKAVEKRARGFEMEIRVYTHADFRQDPSRSALRALLGACDVVVITLPLTEETEGIIGEEEFAGMRPQALLVNVSRGEVVQEAALFNALEKSRIRGAAVDTWYNYPDGFFSWDRPYSLNFAKFPNLLMTPHVAYRSDDLETARLAEIKSFLTTVLRGKPPASLVNINAGY